MFNTGLYYPTIEINNDDWLKSAILLWDRIETIVPEGNTNPYRRRATKYLSDEGLLVPHVVNPFNREVAVLAEDVYRYLRTAEGLRSIRRPIRTYTSFNDYLRQKERKLIGEYDDFYIHILKFPFSLQNMLSNYATDEGYIMVGASFMNYYMTLLANRICQMNNLALLTDRVMLNSLSNRVMTDGLSWPEDGNVRDEERLCMMFEVVMDKISINSNTPIERIVRFKRNRNDELKLFREKMDELTRFDMTGMTYEDIKHEMNAIYVEEVLPVINELKKALNDAQIDWRDSVRGCLLTGIFPALFAGPSVQTIAPVVIGYGIDLAVKAKNCRKKKQEIENRSPYAYLLKMDRYLNR